MLFRLNYRLAAWTALAFVVLVLMYWRAPSPAGLGDLGTARFLRAKPRYAVMTFLGANHDADPRDHEMDGYFRMTRALCYKFVHDPRTRLPPDIPYIVLVTPDYDAAKRRRYEAYGAQVREIALIDAPWVQPALPRWHSVMSKLRMWQMTEFEKVLYVEVDHMVLGPLAPLFDVINATATGQRRAHTKPDEPPLPATHLLAARPEMPGDHSHDYPPAEADNLNAGFMLLQPSEDMFEYYLGLLDLHDRYDASFPEQNLLNYAHRPDGNMPWKHVPWKWNMNWGREEDLDHGVRSQHARFYTASYDWWMWPDEPLRQLWEKQDSEARGFYYGTGVEPYDAHWDEWGERRRREKENRDQKAAADKELQEQQTRQKAEKEEQQKEFEGKEGA